MTNFRTLATEMLARLFARSDEYKKRLKSSPGQLDLFGGPRADIQKSVKFDPDKHPRAPKGDTAHHGGQFVPKDEAKADVSKPPEDEPAKVPPEPEKKPEPAASEEPEIPEEFYDTEFDTGEPVGESPLSEMATDALEAAGLTGEVEFGHGAKLSDIPYDLAYNAHSGTSFVPDVRAKQRQQDYINQMEADWNAMSGLAETDADREQLKTEFARYRQGYAAKYRAKLSADSRTMSAMITGPARFPTERNRKRLDTADKRYQELVDFRNRALKAIRRKITPETTSIQANNPQAVTLLEKQLAEHEAIHARMKAINAAHKKYLSNPASLEKSGLSDKEKEFIKAYKPAYSWEPHPYPPYRITNNGANIRRIKQRIADVSKMKAGPKSETQYTGGVSVSEDPDAARIRIHFPGKPPRETIAELKSSGFRWSPSESAWQRSLNNAGRWAVESVLTKLGHVKQVAAEPETQTEDDDFSEIPPMLPVSNDEPAQYAKRPLKSSPGQIDLFGGKSTSGQQKDLLSQKPKGDKKWTAEDEKKHPRDEGGKFTFLNAGTGERSKAVHDALDTKHTMDADMVGMMFNVVHPSQHGDLRKAIDAVRPDLSDVTERHEREHAELANKLPGGKGDKTPDAALPPKELAKGAAVESEHSSDPATAKEIAKDHLTEDTGYYDKLKKMEEKPKTPAAGMPQPNTVTTEDAAPTQPAAKTAEKPDWIESKASALVSKAKRPQYSDSIFAEAKDIHENDGYEMDVALMMALKRWEGNPTTGEVSGVVVNPLKTMPANVDKAREANAANVLTQKPNQLPGVPGQQRGLFNQEASGQKKLFDVVAPKKPAKKPEPEKSLAESIEPVKQPESLPGQGSLLKESEPSKLASAMKDDFEGAKQKWIDPVTARLKAKTIAAAQSSGFDVGHVTDDKWDVMARQGLSPSHALDSIRADATETPKQATASPQGKATAIQSGLSKTLDYATINSPAQAERAAADIWPTMKPEEQEHFSGYKEFASAVGKAYQSKQLHTAATDALAKAGLHQGATTGDNQEKIRGLPHGGTVEISRVGDTSVKAERSGDGKTLTTYRETPSGSEVIKRERWPYETRDWDAQGNWLGGKIATDDPRWKAFMASPERKARLAKQEPKSIAAATKEKDPEAAVAKAEAKAERSTKKKPKGTK